MAARRIEAGELLIVVALVAELVARCGARGDIGLSGGAGRPQTAQTSARAESSTRQPKQNMGSRLPHLPRATLSES